MAFYFAIKTTSDSDKSNAGQENPKKGTKIDDRRKVGEAAKNRKASADRNIGIYPDGGAGAMGEFSYGVAGG